MNCVALLCTAISMLAFSSTCFAQTAEETAAFLISGLEDGRTVRDGTEFVATVRRIDGPGASFSWQDRQQNEIAKFSVTQPELCKFKLAVVRSDGGAGSVVYDFENLEGLSILLSTGDLRFSGACPIKEDGGKCTKLTTIVLDDVVTPRRLEKAYRYMKSEFCRGLAF